MINLSLDRPDRESAPLRPHRLSLGTLAAGRCRAHIPARERRSNKTARAMRGSEVEQRGEPLYLSVGILNACAMLQLTSNLDLPASAVLRAPRMSNDENRSVSPSGPSTSVITKVKPKTKRPNLYRVLILNDDYTPMEFVVHVLEKFFNKDIEAATKIMLHVHHHGIGECGVFTYEIAETKVTQVMDFSRKHQHPLQCVMEKK